MTTYTQRSPWKNTRIVNSQYLGIMQIRSVPASPDDRLYTIQPQYEHRPDLLAYDYYKDSQLWWVFAQRNMNVLLDPIYDFVTGTEIYLPDPTSLRKFIG